MPKPSVDDIVRVFGDQLEQTDCRKMAALVRVGFTNPFLQHFPNGMGLGRAWSTEEIEARGVLAGHATDIAHDAQATVQFSSVPVRPHFSRRHRVCGLGRCAAPSP